MIYLYYQKITKRLYVFKSVSDMVSVEHAAFYLDNIEAVTTEHKRGQVTANKFEEGIVFESPINRTVLISHEIFK